MIAVDQVDRGLECNCVCPECFQQLVACKGEIVRPYFRHYADPTRCVHARETALHLYAKQLIARRRRLLLSDDMGQMLDATVEARLPFAVTPDVLCKYESTETLAVEIWVAHQVPVGKVQLYAKHNQAAVEIDLRDYRHIEQANWDAIILEQAPRMWIFPPFGVRLENERRRQAIIDQYRREREQAMEAMRAAQEAASLEAKKLQSLKRADEIRWQREVVDQALKLAHNRLAEAERQQSLVKAAEERARTAEARAALRLRRMRERRGPDLQALVKAFGTYQVITPEAWEQFDRDTDTYKQRVRSGYFYSNEHTKEFLLAS